MYTYARTYVRTYITANTNLLYYNCVTIRKCYKCSAGKEFMQWELIIEWTWLASHKMVLQALQISIDGHTNVVTK